VATDIMGVSGRAMIEALTEQRDPTVLAGLARGRMKTKRSALDAALDGHFDDHHGELARLLLDSDYHTRRINIERCAAHSRRRGTRFRVPLLCRGASATVSDRRGDRADGGLLLDVTHPIMVAYIGTGRSGEADQGGGETGGDGTGDSELPHFNPSFLLLRKCFPIRYGVLPGRYDCFNRWLSPCISGGRN